MNRVSMLRSYCVEYPADPDLPLSSASGGESSLNFPAQWRRESGGYI